MTRNRGIVSLSVTAQPRQGSQPGAALEVNDAAMRRNRSCKGYALDRCSITRRTLTTTRTATFSNLRWIVPTGAVASSVLASAVRRRDSIGT